jgi:hypothetical protein
MDRTIGNLDSLISDLASPTVDVPPLVDVPTLKKPALLAQPGKAAVGAPVDVGTIVDYNGQRFRCTIAGVVNSPNTTFSQLVRLSSRLCLRWLKQLFTARLR